jgi:hypothetical protein
MINIGKIVILTLWGILFINNLANITKNRIDAEKGILWAIVIGGFEICLGLINLKWTYLLELPSTWIIEIEEFIFICILYKHEISITDINKKNNELAIQLALIKAQEKVLEEELNGIKKGLKPTAGEGTQQAE